MSDWLFDLGNSRFKFAPLQGNRAGSVQAWAHGAEAITASALEALPRGDTAWEMNSGGGNVDTGGGGMTATGGGGGAAGGGGGGVAHEASRTAVSTPSQAQGARGAETGAWRRAAQCGAGSMSLMWANLLKLIGPGLASSAHMNGWMACIVNRLWRFAQ